MRDTGLLSGPVVGFDMREVSGSVTREVISSPSTGSDFGM